MEKQCLIVTTVSFMAIMLYYYVVSPDYVRDDTKNISLRLALVYSMLFSSGIGILFLTISMIFERAKKEPNKLSVEPPTFR
jgi:hypothetical protein